MCPPWSPAEPYRLRAEEWLFPQRKMSAVSRRWGNGCRADVYLEGLSLVLRDMAEESDIVWAVSLYKEEVI